MNCLFVFFCVLVMDFMALYMLYYVHVKADPGFAYTHAEHDLDKPVLSVMALTIALLVLYYLWYLIAICNNLRQIMLTDFNTKVTFLSSQLMHFAVAVTLTLGVYSRHFANGGIQLFFIGLCNLYVFVLVYLNWPQRVKFQEYALAEDQEWSSLNENGDSTVGELNNRNEIELQLQQPGQLVLEEEKSATEE